MRDIAIFPPMILIGVWAATLSSALGSIVAAPRTLQAMALDGIVPRVLGSKLGSRTEPRVGVLVTATVAFAIIWAGDLNVVAPIITMFFLNTYGMTNLVAGIEKLVGNPSFRTAGEDSSRFFTTGCGGLLRGDVRDQSGGNDHCDPGQLWHLLLSGAALDDSHVGRCAQWDLVFAMARQSLLNLERSVVSCEELAAEYSGVYGAAA